ncbi:uncharacterized protein MONOS_8462 [Monocercomonoides exilis]|uniref:uncharacterized protein n=1 Tax=Monocercomonoides exilis TaxID=2049356 RepID=UPI003559D654|nr:hypothetical protein MONOS_8462 [Monocercomonoides exilis]|eukprot:MONOS_8462.1-p1 / transcript=MONOS_8462.1 / gene=MONOS_8462 / organism=Monocercomonoides_exilis_PA203 / gene_product=unspecified product / transcript_product=unspecified product / location=Mono_scaffold00319:51693-62936(-) / protein_length=3747 / sequence_SO=supercontig / SO=protein_coding / is_pseudo=false
MIFGLSGILYCVWIISVGCVCKGSTSDGAGFVEESAKEGELDYPEGTWREKAQNNKIGDGHLFDTYVEGKEGGARETWKEAITMKKCTKRWNGRSGEIGKVEKWGFCDEWKMWGKGSVCGGSGVEGSVVGVNSSIQLNLLGLREMGGESVLRASDGSSVEVSGCVIGVERVRPPFDLCGSCGLFTNISLRSSSTSTSTSTEQIFPPLFSSKTVEGEISEKCHISVCSSHFSSFCVSSAPFLSSHFVSLSYLTFFNISTNPQKTRQLGEGQSQTSFLMSGCTFSSVWDVYDGGIVSSLNSPSSSLSASNASFVRCYRSQNVAVSGSEGNPSKPGRQQIADNGANSFTWCVWNGSKTTGTSGSYSDGTSNGGAIYMYNLRSGTLSVKFCLFNDCTAYYAGGGIFCVSINSIKIENNSFNACISQTYGGGGLYANSITSCVRVNGCEFKSCNGKNDGGGLFLNSFNVSGSSCIGAESGKGESACVFECSFTTCSLTHSSGGGMYCYGVPAAFKMRSLQFISCSAVSYGGGLDFRPYQSTAPSYNHYCYFFFFHDCRCTTTSTPYGLDVYLEDRYNFFSSNNPFYESYTTNSNDTRVCLQYYNGNNWVNQHTEKKGWLKEGMKERYVVVSGSDASNLCGMSEAAPCKTVGHALWTCALGMSSTIMLMGGKHVSEGATISVGEKTISVVGRGKTVSVIGTSALSSPATTLFSISSGQLEVGHVGIDHNSMRSPSPSVFVVSLGSGALSLEDVVIDSSTPGGSVKSASVFEVALRQLKMIDVEIKNMKMSRSLFAEPSSAGLASGESVLANVTIRNVNRTTGDGVVMAKSVMAGETFFVWNTTIEGCECVNGNGGGIKVELASSTSQVRIGDSTSHSGGITSFKQCKCSGCGGGVMLWLADNSFDFAISAVSFVGCSATLGGKDVFVNGSRLVSGTITTAKLNVGHNASIYDELMGYDRNEGEMGIFPLNVFFDTFSGAAHVGKAVNGYGGYDSWFCGFGYFPCKTISHAVETRFATGNKIIVLDSGFELGEVVSMAGSYEWEVYCGVNKTNVNVRVPSGMTSSCLINVESKSSIKNIGFQIPFSLSSATSLIVLTSSSLTLTDCSVAHISESTSSVAFGYSIVNAHGGSLKMERFVIGGALVFGAHSAIEFCEGMTSVICSGCNISGVKRNEGDGGWMKGTVGTSGTLTVDGCNVNGCSCVGGKGGGIYVGLKGNGNVVVSGTSVIDGNKAENNGGRGGRGGGMFVLMESEGCGLTIGQNVKFSKDHGNVAEYGKDVFVDCGSGVFLESKVNTSSFSFFDTSTIPSDVLKLSGSENGNESEVIPLFVYLCTMGSKVLVDGSGGNGMDHNHCGFEAFRCLTVDYCANSRMSSTVNEIEVVSSSSIAKEITGPSFGVSISGRIVSSDGERMEVNVSDGGSATQDWLVGCSSSLTMRRLSFVVKGQLKARRSAFIHSTSTLNMTNCSVSFESGALTDGKIGYSIIDMAGGNLIVDGFVMESGGTLTMNGKSPITMTNGVQLEILNSRVSGVEVNVEVAGGNGGGGCLNVGMGVNGNVKIEESNFSSRCSGGSGMKGGGMMISVGSGGTLRAKGVNLSECVVPSEDVENGGRGMGGGMFAEVANQMGTFSLESMTFSGCNAWKGKNLFVEAQDLSAVINSTSIGFNPEIGINVADLNELCGIESGKPELIVPLVVFLRTFSSPAYVSGRGQGSEFRLCGYEDYPCRRIGEASEYRYPNSKRMIRLTSTFSFDEEVKLDEESYEIDSSNKDVGLKVGGTGTKTQEALVMNSVSSTLTGILFELGESIWEHTSFVHSSGGTLRFADCGIKMGNGVDAVNYEFASASGGNVEIIRMSCGGSERKVKFGMKAFIVINGNGGASIEDSLLESVETTNMKGLIEYSSSSSSLTIGNVTAQECVMGGKGLIWDENGKKLGMRNCTIMKMSSLEGNGGVVSGEVGNGCAIEVNDVVIEGCGTLKGCGGGIAVILKGTGEMRLGKSGVVTSFEKCSAGGEGSIGGYGGGVNLDLSDNCVNNFVLTTLTFKDNVAAEGRDLFISCKKLNETVTKERFGFEYKYENGKGEGEWMAVDMKGIDRDHFAESVDLRLFLVEMKGREVCVSREGYDTLGCGSDGYPCESMWSGISHIDRSETEGERKVKVKDEGTIEDVYSFTDALVIDGCVNEGDETKHKPIQFNERIKGNSASSSSSVISSTVSLSLLSLKLQIPSQFEPNLNSLISSSGVLQLESCLFEILSSTAIQYSLISTISGSCTLKGCSLTECSFSISPLVMASSVLFENSNFSNIRNTGSGEEGGVAKVTLKNEEELVMKSTNASSCSLSSGNGKGGFLYLDCQNCLNEKPFLLENVSFSNNNAAIGKNVFILGKDFNSSVINESFKFDYSSMKDDNNLFVGSDDFHSSKDLFMFLIPFSSFEIFISSSGFDVARCGSEEEPCFTMWKGMKNMRDEDENKTIQIEGSTFIRDSFNVSNYQIKKSVKIGEEDTKAILNFEKSIGSQPEYFMENDIHLELTNIQLRLTSGFDNSAKTIISSRAGELVITGCSFHSEAGVNNGFDCVFVDVIGGSVEVNDLSIESCNVGNSIFVIHDAGITCHFVNIRVESLNESRGCILSIKKSEQGFKINEECVNIEINNSSFSGVKRSDNGPNILESKSEKRICLAVNSSNITEDKAEMSEKGGAIFFTLGVSGSMKMIDSTISQCSCTNGKGGGVYLATKERGFLDFTFTGMKFSSNTARVGNDIFIECFNIPSQINESQFQFDLRENHYSRINAIYGIDSCEHKEDTDLIEFVTIHQSDTIVVSSVNGSNDRQCGTNALPCDSIEHGLMHLTSEYVSLLYVDTESVIGREINLEEMSLSSKSRENCKVEVKSRIEKTKDSLISTRETVSLVRVNFVFDSNFISSHESLISPEGGILEIINCSFDSKQSAGEGSIELANIPFLIIKMEKGELQLMECKISNLILHESSLSLLSSLASVIDSLTICNSTISKSLIDVYEYGQLTIKDFKTENITVEGNEESLICCLSMKKTMQLTNCTMGRVSSNKTKGKLIKLGNCLDVKMDSCIFDGSSNERNEQYLNTEEEMCRWEGSLVDVAKSSVMMKDSTISNSPEGGITINGGALIVNDGRFENNNPSIEGYPSLRRNIICSDSGTLNVVCLKGGDGWERNTSLWMLNDGCSFEGIASERDSSFFIPVLESVEAKEETDRMKLIFKGMLLIPCNLSFSVVKKKGEEKEIEKHDFDRNGLLSEREAEGNVEKDLVSSCGDDIEVSVLILFGVNDYPSSTNSFILKNASEAKTNGDERIAEGGKEGKSYWLLIVIVLVVILLIVLIVSIVLAVRWRKEKEEAKKYKEIVDDNIKKDPKAFEMVTMEMSPEAQWRREEKKNEENAKKRVYEKKMVHSESEEYLLAESGSTEYILGKDSDKIPEWALEIEEEEEIRKRTPSPSISSTDTNTTFVRMDDLCPTTSSISNLVDAIACSSPHEKLIVDLRDSLFMLLHGRNKTKEMAIGTLKEREQTAAEVLLLVANLALHSFDEMEVPLSSLENLSPHIVLFSEHMVICIALHSDCSSDDDSDSSSISSSTDVTSASDDDDDSDSLPSSAFKDEPDNWNDCLRWKAPELQMKRKIGATKESVVFSMGMMLWEILTVEIPFGEYPAEVAGQKIVNGERPEMEKVAGSSFGGVVKGCVVCAPGDRCGLGELRRELAAGCGPGAMMVTASDALCLVDGSVIRRDKSGDEIVPSSYLKGEERGMA